MADVVVGHWCRSVGVVRLFQVESGIWESRRVKHQKFAE